MSVAPRMGALFGTADAIAGGVSLELSGMRTDRRGGQSGHRIALAGHMIF